MGCDLELKQLLTELENEGDPETKRRATELREIASELEKWGEWK